MAFAKSLKRIRRMKHKHVDIITTYKHILAVNKGQKLTEHGKRKANLSRPLDAMKEGIEL